ncbi:MAG: taurine dioxygenase [Polyangiaceae bacterium]|nr:taurine dioxygenase [Polyangiaceae bacterium]
MIGFHPLASLGAEVSGVDLRAALDDATFALLHRGLVEHQVLFFRDQDVGPEHHLALARRFGEPVSHPAYPTVTGHPEINVLENTPEKPPKIDTWHTDMTFMEQPPLGSILRATVVPPSGGDTLWASLFGAWDALSDRLQRYLDGMTATHSFAHGFRHSLAEAGGWDRLGDAVRANPPVHHPVVRRHPVSGRKALFVNRLFTTHLDGVKESESDALLRFLFDHLETPEISCRFRWRPHSIAFWDNRSTLHRPVNDFWPAHRRMERITIAGDRPR